MGTAIVLIVLAGIVALAARKVIRDRKNGVCAGGCAGCGGQRDHCCEKSR